MKIAWKLALAVGIWAVVIFGAVGWFLLRSEQEDLLRVAERETRLLLRSVQVSVENALRDRQWEDVEVMIEGLDRVDPTVDLVVFDPDGLLRAASRGAPVRRPEVVAALEQAAQTGRPVILGTLHGEDGSSRLVHSLPLDGGAGRVGIIRSLDEVREDLLQTRRTLVGGVSLFLAITVVLVLALGATHIGRPLAQLLGAMRGLQPGSAPRTLAVRRRDEVGEVAQAFNELARRLDEANARLETELESRRRVMDALVQQDKLATLGQLAATVAHEVGSPLQIVSGRARMLAEGGIPAEGVQHNARIIVREAERMARIVQSVLAVGRRRTLEKPEVDLRPPVRAVVELMELEARRRGVTLSLETPPELPRACVNPDALQQVVLNLVQNALRSTGAGGEVAVRLRPAALAVPGTSSSVSGVAVEVADSGEGVAAGMEESIFQPFVTTRGEEGGTGLGLSVVQAIAHDHQGQVRVSRTPGGGATFTVELPLRPVLGGALEASASVEGEETR